MSEVTVFIRQGDPNRASKKGQKRPLSIITENDSDDLDAINFAKLQDGTDGNGKENSLCCKDIPETNKTCQEGEIICKVSEIARNARNPGPLSDFKTSLWLPVAGSKYQVPSKLIKIPLVKLPPETRFAVLENLPSHSITISEGENSKCPDENFWKQQGVNSFSAVTQDAKSAEIQQYNQISTTTCNDTPGAINGTQINNVALPNPVDVNSLAKIREVSDRLHIIVPLNTTLPSTPSPQMNGTFCYRRRQQTSTPKTVQEVKSPTSPNPQHLPSNTLAGSPVLVSPTIASNPDSDETTDKSSSDNNSPSDSNLGNMFSKFTASKLSAYFSRRMSNESTGSLSENELSDGDTGADDSPSAYLSYFRRLKETTDKLHLSARRPSIMLWRQQYLESQNFPRVKSNLNSDIADDSLTLDRKHRIDRALEWLKISLQEMRSQDQHLARQLLSIRHDIHKLKLQRSTEEHQELIDDFHFELQELQEFSDILDLPIPEHFSNPLKQIGITRLNISARRFSAC